MLKKAWIAVANTTEPSIYSTDGQMNVIIVIVAILGLMISFHFLNDYLFKKDKEPDEHTELSPEETDLINQRH